MFRGYVADVAAQALNSSATDMDTFFAEKWAKDEGLTVKEALSAQIAVIGENMNIRRFERVEAVSYTHLDVYKRQRLLWSRERMYLQYQGGLPICLAQDVVD